MSASSGDSHDLESPGKDSITESATPCIRIFKTMQISPFLMSETFRIFMLLMSLIDIMSRSTSTLLRPGIELLILKKWQ